MERSLQTCLQQSKEKSFPVDFTKTKWIINIRPQWNITYMLDYLMPKDDKDNESDYHNTVRTQTERPIQTANDRE